MQKLIFSFENDIGVPVYLPIAKHLPGGLITTFAPNSRVLKPTFTDRNKVTENVNPVIFDSTANAQVWLDGAYAIEIQIDFPDLNTVFRLDYVTDLFSFHDTNRKDVLCNLFRTL